MAPSRRDFEQCLSSSQQAGHLKLREKSGAGQFLRKKPLVQTQPAKDERKSNWQWRKQVIAAVLLLFALAILYVAYAYVKIQKENQRLAEIEKQMQEEKNMMLRHSMESYGYRFESFLIHHQSLIIWIITVIGGLLSIYFGMTHYSEVEKLRIIKYAEVKISIATIEGKTNQSKAEIDGNTERINCAIENGGNLLQAVITPFAKFSEIVAASFLSKKVNVSPAIRKNIAITGKTGKAVALAALKK